MLINSRVLAFLLAISISLVTTAFLSLVEDVSKTALLVAFIISFAAAYLLIKIILDFLIFNEVNKIYDVLDKIKSKDPSFLDLNKKSSANPFRKINVELYSYATIKQREIDELKKMEAFRREFIADVSHELKTPIFSAQGFVHTLLDGAIEDKKVRQKFLRKAAKSLDGLDMLVQDLLTLSQMETGQIKMQYESFNIYELTQEVIEQLEGKSQKKAIKVNFAEGVSNPVFVRADQQRIYQVMLNLLSNAIKYTKEEGEVVINFEREEDNIIISVEDNGRGIPEEDINRIFERFYRVEKSRSKDKGGTGLGLAIVKHILEAHDTKVEVMSEVDKGSVFSFKLPIG
ncbi:ATP-binding protein [Fulvivirgaceae bacterium BMA10]|uniref:histidine kinase n=1 Tax=Splendidivirga corallicola TaxID=3051826 RepID=A0ABT8KJ76_9BACT|nr:ATP-binding protein [Fulvivirgaceae bacterium BMA10]